MAMKTGRLPAIRLYNKKLVKGVYCRRFTYYRGVTQEIDKVTVF
jgi:hypothetical protein